MYDNKIRISQDVIEKAQLIAEEWGLKTPRAALEAVFRKYADDYLYGRQPAQPSLAAPTMVPTAPSRVITPMAPYPRVDAAACDAIDALDDLLAM